MPFRANIYTYNPERADGLLIAVPVRCLHGRTSFKTASRLVAVYNNRRWPFDGEFWWVEPEGEFAAVEEVDE